MYGGCRQVHLMDDDNGGNQEDQVQVLQLVRRCDASCWMVFKAQKNFSGNATEEESHSHAHHYHHVDHTVSLSLSVASQTSLQP